MAWLFAIRPKKSGPSHVGIVGESSEAIDEVVVVVVLLLLETLRLFLRRAWQVHLSVSIHLHESSLDFALARASSLAFWASRFFCCRPHVHPPVGFAFLFLRSSLQCAQVVEGRPLGLIIIKG